MKSRQIKQKDFDLILKQDKMVYPTDSPVTKKILTTWFQNNPEFGIIFKEKNKIVGNCIVIPLNKRGWTKLVNGKLNESDLNEKTIFNNKRDNKVGIQIYHIEKLDLKIKGLYINCLKKISKNIKDLKKTTPN